MLLRAFWLEASERRIRSSCVTSIFRRPGGRGSGSRGRWLGGRKHAGRPGRAPAGGGVSAAWEAGGQPAADSDEWGGGVAALLGHTGESKSGILSEQGRASGVCGGGWRSFTFRLVWELRKEVHKAWGRWCWVPPALSGMVDDFWMAQIRRCCCKISVMSGRAVIGRASRAGKVHAARPPRHPRRPRSVSYAPSCLIRLILDQDR
jgi:hypothetical protein